MSTREPVPEPGASRLGRLSEYLKTLPVSAWDFARTVTQLDPNDGCGTICCAIGWLPMLWPEHWSWIRPIGAEPDEIRIRYATNPRRTFLDVADFFRITTVEALTLFAPNRQAAPWNDAPLEATATAKDVARSIDRFLAWRSGSVPPPEPTSRPAIRRSAAFRRICAVASSWEPAPV